MRFRCERDVLLDALTTCSRAVSKRSGPAAVSGSRLLLTADALHVVATDYDLTIEADVVVSGMEDGACVLPAALLVEIVRTVEPGAVTLEAEQRLAHISAGRSQFSVQGYPDEEFPRLVPVKGDGVVLEGSELGEAIRQVARAASTDESRQVLTGVLLDPDAEGLRLVATDTYRMAVRYLPGLRALPEGQQVVVPARALAELQRLLAAGRGPQGGRARGGGEEQGSQVTLRVGEGEVAFEVGAVTMTSRLVDAEFPHYQQIIPASYPTKLTIGKDHLLDAIRRVRLLVRESNPKMSMSMSDEGVELAATDEERGEASERVDATYEGEPITIFFNPAYLVEGIDAVNGDEVVIETREDNKPARISSVDDDTYMYLLMPVRRSQ